MLAGKSVSTQDLEQYLFALPIGNQSIVIINHNN